MDIISMIMSQNRGGGEPIAYTEPGKKYTWDGDISNTEVNDSTGMPVYKISSDIIDPYKVSKVTLYISGQGEFVQDKKQFEIVDRTAEVGMYIITLGFFTGAGNILISVGGDNAIAPVGIYLSYVEDNGVVAYISAIELKETIHPIDPKYIPGAVLPVVEITTELNGQSTVLTAEENAALNAACGLPICVKTAFGTLLFEYANADGEESFAGVSSLASGCMFFKTPNGWVADFQQ